MVETARDAGFYPEDEYDLAGFAVGIADEKGFNHAQRCSKWGSNDWYCFLRHS